MIGITLNPKIRFKGPVAGLRALARRTVQKVALSSTMAMLAIYRNRDDLGISYGLGIRGFSLRGL